MFNTILLAAAGYSINQPTSDNDEHIANTELLLKGEGSDGQNNNTFLDSSGFAAHTITRYGNTTQGSFSPFSPKGWSGYFDGSNDYLNCGSSSDFAFGTGQFTIEAWFYSTGTQSGSGLFATSNSFGPDTYQFDVNRSEYPNKWGFTAGAHYSNDRVTSTSNIQNNVWTHLAVTRNSSNLVRLFVNGVLEDSSTISNNFSSTGPLKIGVNRGNNNSFNGYISNARLLKGTCLYTSNFTPPTAPLTAVTNTKLLTLQDNRFIDNSASNHSITVNGETAIKATSPFSDDRTYPKANYFSGYFDGSGDYLDITSNLQQTGDFTIEFWFYAHSIAQDDAIYSWGSNTTYMSPCRFASTTSLGFYKFGVGLIAETGTNTVQPGQWYHVAVTKNSSNTLSIWLDGVLKDTYAFGSDPYGNSNGVHIGADADLNQYFYGYISDFRCVSSCLYTSNFTPPTAPLTPVANTKLLTLQDNYLVDHSSSSHSITNNGGVTFVPESPFSNSTYPLSGTFYSGQFDSTSTNLTVSNSSGDFTIGSGDFTLEAWIYLTSANDTNYIMEFRTSSVTGAPIFVVTAPGDSSPRVLRFHDLGPNIKYDSVNSISLNQWVHVAVTRDGSNIKIFLNGNLESTTSGSQSINCGGNITIGTRYDNTFSFDGGYISNLRFVKGTALYTSDFTVPTEPLTAVSGTKLLTLQDASVQDNSSSNHSITNNGATITEIAPFGAELIDRAGSMYLMETGII